jgi:hypothetical protein
MGFVVDKVALRTGFSSEYFGSPCQLFYRLFHTHHHLLSGPSIIGLIVGDVPSELSFTPPQELLSKLAPKVM